MSESKHTPVAWLVATGATHEGRETYTRHEQRPPLCDAEPIYAPDLAAEVERLKSALTKISGIRDSMIGCQKVNWSEHVYPLVAALDETGFEGASYEVARDQIGTLLERTNKAEAEVEELRKDHRSCPICHGDPSTFRAGNEGYGEEDFDINSCPETKWRDGRLVNHCHERCLRVTTEAQRDALLKAMREIEVCLSRWDTQVTEAKLIAAAALASTAEGREGK